MPYHAYLPLPACVLDLTSPCGVLCRKWRRMSQMNSLPHSVALNSHLHYTISLCISIAFERLGFNMKHQELCKLSELKKDTVWSGTISTHGRWLRTQSQAACSAFVAALLITWILSLCFFYRFCKIPSSLSCSEACSSIWELILSIISSHYLL